MNHLPKPEILANQIHGVRDEKIILDRDLTRKINKLEKNYDEQFALVFKAIKQLLAGDTTPTKPKRRIGFTPSH